MADEQIPDFMIVLESSSTIAAAATDSSVTPKKPMRPGTIVEFSASVIDPAYSSQSTAANQYALLERIGAKILLGGEPIAGTGSNDFVPLSVLLGSREKPRKWKIRVGRDLEVSAEFKSFDTSGAPALKVRLVGMVVSDNPPRRED